MSYWPVLNPLLRWKGGKYKGISGEDIAKAMVKLARNETEKVKIYHWSEMHDLYKLNSRRERAETLRRQPSDRRAELCFLAP